jgi:hypothetical protein
MIIIAVIKIRTEMIAAMIAVLGFGTATTAVDIVGVGTGSRVANVDCG